MGCWLIYSPVGGIKIVTIKQKNKALKIFLRQPEQAFHALYTQLLPHCRLVGDTALWVSC